LKRNDVGASGCRELITALKNSKTVRVLDLSGNNIGDEGARVVVESLRGKTK
jgi:Ran GTPase-activating protein (RanGAP) involved in mRNA processing and transport